MSIYKSYFFMNIKNILLSLILSLIINGCNNYSSSNMPDLPISQQTKGRNFIAKYYLPANVKYMEIAKAKANARYGYESVVTLYTLLADIARKIVENLVINIYGGHTVTAFI